jgi:hypothetical protein
MLDAMNLARLIKLWLYKKNQVGNVDFGVLARDEYRQLFFRPSDGYLPMSEAPDLDEWGSVLDWSGVLVLSLIMS